MFEEPVLQLVGSLGNPASLPTEPLLMVQPKEGEILQSIATDESQELEAEIEPATEVLFTDNVAPVQIVSKGETVKLATGGNEILIGTTDPLVTPHGFSTNRFAENAFGKVTIPFELFVPQEERVKR